MWGNAPHYELGTFKMLFAVWSLQTHKVTLLSLCVFPLQTKICNETHKMTTVVVFGETVGKIMPHFFK